jgi:hypothetical protein
MDEQEERKAHLRLVESGIIDNSTLREALDDDQANQLIDWGLDEIDKFVKLVLDTPVAEATKAVEQRAELVANIMRYVNRFVRDVKNPLADEDVPVWCEKLCNSVDELAGVSPDSRAQIESLYENRFLFSLEEVFDTLMGILQALDEEE